MHQYMDLCVHARCNRLLLGKCRPVPNNIDVLCVYFIHLLHHLFVLLHYNGSLKKMQSKSIGEGEE